MVKTYNYGSITNGKGDMIAVREDSRGNLFDCNGNLVDEEEMLCYERLYYIIRRFVTRLFIFR